MDWRALFARLRQAFGGDPHAPEVLAAAAAIPTGLSRRAFLRTALIATTIAATVDVEHLLWMPGEKTIFLPTPDDLDTLVGHGFASADWIAREALKMLSKHLTVVGQFNRAYEIRDGARVGDTVRVPRPDVWGPGWRTRPVLKDATVTLDRQLFVEVPPPVLATAAEAKQYVERELRPHVTALAERIKCEGLTVFGGLELPKGAETAARVTKDGLSVRAIQAFDVTEGRVRCRVDVLGGTLTT